MTKEQAAQIKELRMQGKGYKAAASAVAETEPEVSGLVLRAGVLDQGERRDLPAGSERASEAQVCPCPPVYHLSAGSAQQEARRDEGEDRGIDGRPSEGGAVRKAACPRLGSVGERGGKQCCPGTGGRREKEKRGGGVTMGRLTFLDICSGIGGFRLGLEWAGHKCIGYCEYDKFARASYEAMYDTEGEWKAYDVTELRPGDIPYADIWCYGFPCQDISIAGKQRGLRGKRSGIYYSIIDLIKGKEEGDKPTYLLVENVKNLLSVNAGFDFAAVLSEMDEAGYDVRWQVLNSKDFGVPQNRERVFLIAVLRSRGGREILPVSGEDGGALKEVIGGMQGYRVYDPSGV